MRFITRIPVYDGFQPDLAQLSKTATGKLQYLEFKGNGENTSSFLKFEIANYDVHFRLNTLSDRFLNGILARKWRFRGAFLAHWMQTKKDPVEIYLITQSHMHL